MEGVIYFVGGVLATLCALLFLASVFHLAGEFARLSVGLRRLAFVLEAMDERQAQAEAQEVAGD